MQRARRLYLYFVSAVSLLALGNGSGQLLTNVVKRLNMVRDTRFVSYSGQLERDASMAFAIVIVALPIWLLHWWLAERAASGTDAQADAERSSAERALYLSAVLLVTFTVFLTSSIAFIRDLVRTFASDDPFAQPDKIPTSVAPMIVAAAVWLYHSYVRRRDERHGAGLAESAVYLRFALYVALVVAAIVGAVNVSGLFSVAAQAIFDERPAVVGQRWWVDSLAGSIAGSLVGLALWGLHMVRANTLVRRTDAVGVLERRSLLRRFALYALTFVGLVVSLVFVAGSMEQLFRELLGAPHGPESVGFRIAEPLFRALPFAGVWYLFGQLVIAEADRSGEAGNQAGVRRIYSYGIALIGLAAGSVGLAGLLATMFDRLAGVATPLFGSGPWKSDICTMVPVALLGSAAWLWQSYRFGHWVESDPDVERTDTIRRVYVYAALASAVVAVLVSLALIVYRILTAILDVETESLGHALSTPAAVFIVSAAVLVYHALLLRTDLMASAGDEAAMRRIVVELTGPAASDEIDDIVEQIAREIPGGYYLRVLERSGASGQPERGLAEVEQRIGERD